MLALSFVIVYVPRLEIPRTLHIVDLDILVFPFVLFGARGARGGHGAGEDGLVGQMGEREESIVSRSQSLAALGGKACRRNNVAFRSRVLWEGGADGWQQYWRHLAYTTARLRVRRSEVLMYKHHVLWRWRQRLRLQRLSRGTSSLFRQGQQGHVRRVQDDLGRMVYGWNTMGRMDTIQRRSLCVYSGLDWLGVLWFNDAQ